MIDRHSKILELIKTHDIDTQLDLAKFLNDAGYNVTQATVSRDIKKLRLIKAMGENGRSRYIANDNKNDEIKNDTFNLFASSVINIDYAENLIVIKTHPGMAQAIGASIDNLKLPDILGSIGGDDTLMVIARDKKAAIKTLKQFQNMR